MCPHRWLGWQRACDLQRTPGVGRGSLQGTHCTSLCPHSLLGLPMASGHSTVSKPCILFKPPSFPPPSPPPSWTSGTLVCPAHGCQMVPVDDQAPTFLGSEPKSSPQFPRPCTTHPSLCSKGPLTAPPTRQSRCCPGPLHSSALHLDTLPRCPQTPPGPYRSSLGPLLPRGGCLEILLENQRHTEASHRPDSSPRWDTRPPGSLLQHPGYRITGQPVGGLGLHRELRPSLISQDKKRPPGASPEAHTQQVSATPKGCPPPGSRYGASPCLSPICLQR